MPDVPQRDHAEAGPLNAEGEHTREVARLDRGAVLGREDQIVAVLPEIPGAFPVAELLSAAHPKGLAADPGKGRQSSESSALASRWRIWRPARWIW